MKKTIYTLAIAAAASLAIGTGANAGSMGYPDGREQISMQEYEGERITPERRVVSRRVVIDREPDLTPERRVVSRRVVVDREPGIGERIVTWPYRAGRTVARTPVIVGETLSGRREIVSDDGFLTRERRLSSRRFERDYDRGLFDD